MTTRMHESTTTERRGRYRSALVAAAAGAALVSALSACTDPGSTTQNSIQRMIDNDPLPVLYFGKVQAQLDCRLKPLDGMKPRIIIDGQMDKDGERKSIAGSSWYGEITVHFDNGKEPGKYGLWATGLYGIAKKGEEYRYKTGIGTSQDSSESNESYDTGYEMVDELYPINNHLDVEFTTTDVPFQLAATCVDKGEEANFTQPATIYSVPYEPRHIED